LLIPEQFADEPVIVNGLPENGHSQIYGTLNPISKISGRTLRPHLEHCIDDSFLDEYHLPSFRK
jgi:hypothetical protein